MATPYKRLQQRCKDAGLPANRSAKDLSEALSQHEAGAGAVHVVAQTATPRHPPVLENHMVPEYNYDDLLAMLGGLQTQTRAATAPAATRKRQVDIVCSGGGLVRAGLRSAPCRH